MSLAGMVYFGGTKRHAAVVAALMLLAGVTASLHAQSLPTPGAPSQPFTAIAQAQNGGAGPSVTYQYGIEFVQVNGSPVGVNSAYPGVDGDVSPVVGRGGLNYDYRISRYEVDGSQWGAFFNAVNTVQQQTGQPIPFISPPGGLSQGGARGRVGNISWRTAAIYCNWLHNNQALTREAFMNGAYDVSTFGVIGNQYTDQLTHNANARFWVPTVDEWIRAAHYDPNRHGTGQGGWWQFSISRDTYGIPAPPGQQARFPFSGLGEVNAGYVTQELTEFTVPLGAYSSIQSPWGLFDTIGASTEWVEEPWHFVPGEHPLGRYHAGAYLTSSPSAILGPLGHSFGQSVPWDDAYWFGFRVVASVPQPGCLWLGAIGLMFVPRSRRYSKSVLDK